MNRAITLPLLIAVASAVPLATLAQSNASADTDAAADAASAALPQAVASAASAADGAPSGADDEAFEQRDAAERQRIAVRRTAAYARYEQDRYACWQRFAVNACLDRARDRRRATLDTLRHEELALNAQERDRRTAARLEELARKQADNAQRGDGAVAPASSSSPAQ